MYKLKNDVKIVLKRHNVTVTQKALAGNQHLATLILEDPIYNARYGHNLEEVGDGGARATFKPDPANPKIGQDAIEIQVNVKKKPESEVTASASQETPTDGEDLKQSEVKPVSKSHGSGLLKQTIQKEDFVKKKSGASGHTKK